MKEGMEVAVVDADKEAREAEEGRLREFAQRVSSLKNFSAAAHGKELEAFDRVAFLQQQIFTEETAAAAERHRQAPGEEGEGGEGAARRARKLGKLSAELAVAEQQWHDWAEQAAQLRRQLKSLLAGTRATGEEEEEEEEANQRRGRSAHRRSRQPPPSLYNMKRRGFTADEIGTSSSSGVGGGDDNNTSCTNALVVCGAPTEAAAAAAISTSFMVPAFPPVPAELSFNAADPDAAVSEERFRELFDSLDAAGRGDLGRADVERFFDARLRDLCTDATEFVREALKSSGAASDGRVTFDEFVLLMLRWTRL